ncbi:MAG: 5'-methylthioadenosine/adenosylhomocysteine nucleosidase [Planctomycetota bacterium]|jgi:adenosylhomocysteine nucleosidase
MRHNRIGAVVCTSVILLLGSCSWPVREAKEVSSEPITAILGAFEREITLLEDELTDTQEQRIEGIRFVSGKLSGKRVVIAWTGIGKVNAAMTATLLIEHFKPSELLFTGIAGGINPQLWPGDIVIAAEIAHHDMGVLTPQSFDYRGAMNPLDGWRNPVFLPADERLLELAQRAAEQLELEMITTTEGQRPPRIMKGIVVTGDVFVASPQKCAELRQQLGADAVEMEGAAVAQICYQRRIPHLVIRSISDKAGEGAVLDKQLFQMVAAKNSGGLVAEIISLMDSKQEN